MINGLGSMLTAAGFIAAAVCVAAPVATEAPSPAASAETLPPAPSKHFFWRVDSPTTQVYLLGTIHILHRSIYPLDPVIQEAFAKSEALVLEVDMRTKKQDEIQAEFGDYAFYGEGRSLQSELTTEEYVRLLELLARATLDADSVQPFRPWFVAILAQQVQALRAILGSNGLVYEPVQGIDDYLRMQAIKLNKPVREIESLREQVWLLTGTSDLDQILFLSWSLESDDRSANGIEALLQAWLHGDTETVWRQLHKAVDDDPAYESVWRLWIDDRNITMADRIEDYLKGAAAQFVAVGSGHLVGPGGIIALLQQRGYTVTQL